MTHPLLLRLRGALQAVADPARASGMRAYMKSPMPFHGVPTPVFRRVCRDVFAGHAVERLDPWRHDVLALWRQAAFREERHGAIELSGDRRARPFQTPALLPMYEEMIVTGAWWDYVDSIAIHRVGPILHAYPEPMQKALERWSRSDDLWKRRTAIISQISFKQQTDLSFLYAVIEPSLDSREFFLRKAIGWALRQYGWVDPEEIRRYVARNERRLSPLSRREALINIEGRRRRTSPASP